MQNNDKYIKAIDLALSGEWDDAHIIVQELNSYKLVNR